jgi:hypothetical protein
MARSRGLGDVYKRQIYRVIPIRKAELLICRRCLLYILPVFLGPASVEIALMIDLWRCRASRQITERVAVVN